MSDPPCSVVPIFATAFGVVPLPEAQKLNPVVAELLTARAAAGGGSSAPLCYESGDDLLDCADEPVRAVSAEVLRGARTVVAAVNDFSAPQWQSLVLQARGSFTLVRQYGCRAARSYPLTSWCAIYCVAAPPPAPERRDSGVLRLYESRLGTMFSDASNSVTRIPYTPGHYTWRPVPGEVAVFPAATTHEIALIRATGQLLILTLRLRFVAPGQEGLSRW